MRRARVLEKYRIAHLNKKGNTMQMNEQQKARINKSRSLPSIRHLTIIPEDEALSKFNDRMSEKYDNEMRRRSAGLRVPNRFQRNARSMFSSLASLEVSTKSGEERICAGDPGTDSQEGRETAGNYVLDLNDDIDRVLQEGDESPESPIKLQSLQLSELTPLTFNH